MPKGVIWAGVSAGSNQAGTIVTGQAITTSPAGWGWALRPWLQPTINAATVSSMARESRGFMLHFLMQAPSVRCPGPSTLAPRAYRSSHSASARLLCALGGRGQYQWLTQNGGRRRYLLLAQPHVFQSAVHPMAGHWIVVAQARRPHLETSVPQARDPPGLLEKFFLQLSFDLD